MLEIKSDIFRELQVHLDQMPIGYPETESGVEIRLLKNLFTPEEAYIATKLDFMPKKLTQIYRKLKNDNISIEELEEKLLKMHEKGTINVGKDNEENIYANAPLAVGMYEYQLGRLTPDLVKNIDQYFEEAFVEEFNKTGIPQVRVIPIEESVSFDTPIATYDQIREIIMKTSNTIGIMDCICRNAHDLLDNPCKKTDVRETCMTFGTAAWFYHNRGVARFVTKEEALELVKKFEDIGLVPQPSNSQKPSFICNCCGCCCEILKNQKKLENPSQYFATNYNAEVDDSQCNGCGICEERCQMDAITIENECSNVNLSRCIGCGVCIPTCPNDAIYLVKKEINLIPPVDTRATYTAIMNKKAELAQRNG
ncbi:MAG: ATP-binding protein [Promethearchaeota archaeon]